MIIFIQDLDNLRERIKGIDYSIMALISQRVNLALQIGKLKNEKNLPVRNFQVEKQVFDRINGYSEEFQLDFQFTKELYKQIIAQSVNAQLNDKYSLAKPSLNQKALVIGGTGKMGRWFVRFLSSSGFNIEIVDPNIKSIDTGYSEIPDDLDGIDYIFVCVPLNRMKEVLQQVISKKPAAIIFEIASLKSTVADLVEKANLQGFKIISIHPMFGPEVTDLSDRNLLVCATETNGEWSLNEVQRIFRDTMVNIHLLELREHDQKMLYSLGLSHFINILNGFILSNTNINYSELQKFAGTTFNNQINTTKEVYKENPELYFSIQQINVYQDQLFSEILHRTAELIEIIKTKDQAKFFNIMKIGDQYLDGGD